MSNDTSPKMEIPAQTGCGSPMPGPVPAQPRRRLILFFLLLLFLLVGAGAAFWWHTNLRFAEGTDDAYVAGNIMRVMPQVGGRVTEVLADANNVVAAGQPLARIDPLDAQLACDRALVDLATAVRTVGRLQAQLRESEAVLRIRRVDLRQQNDNLARREVLSSSNAIGTEELRHARDGVESAAAALAVAEEQRNALAAQLPDAPIAEQPAVKQAAAVVRDRWLALQRTTISSPVAGQIARRNVQPGEVVAPATALMAVVPLDKLWVDANFKEGQLHNMRIGQPAVVRADIYGTAVTYRGRVAGFAAGTGSAFSLLPAQNATGNWIKIVQRVPVRIEIDPADIKAHPLLVGLSTQVTVDTSAAAGPLLLHTPTTTPAAMADGSPEPDFAPVEALITEVIERNTPQTATTDNGKTPQ